MGSTTIYVPENLRPSRTPSFTAFLNDKNFTLLKPGKQENPGLLRGPRRVLRLCLFALVLPAVLITIPLYVRLVLYPPGHYPMMPTDQRLLARHVSSIWCQSQSTHMNGSFSSYISPNTPAMKSERVRYVMVHSIILRDDIKEYWGFHLLKGSRVTVSTCSSREGAQLMILRGVDNLRRCAWIGEEDSLEEEEEERIASKDRKRVTLTTEIVKSNPILRNLEAEAEEERDWEPLWTDLDKSNLRLDSTSPVPTYEDESEERRQNLQQLLKKAVKMSKNKKEILKILHSVGRRNKKPLPKRIKQIMGVSSDENNASSRRATARKTNIQNNNNNNTNSSIEKSTLKLKRSISQDNEEEEEDNDGAFEEFDEEEISHPATDQNSKEIDSAEGLIRGHIFFPEGLKFERGKFNQTNEGDKSDEENYSSYSSSEEALASCEGVILTLPLVAYRSCSYRWMEINKITYDIPVTGTYYFVYSSDNEIDTNTIYLNMTFEKVVYDIDESQIVCANTTDCSIPLSFWSNQKIVVEVPREDTWDNSYLLDTTCEPRVPVYLTFLILVPILILFCAFQ